MSINYLFCLKDPQTSCYWTEVSCNWTEVLRVACAKLLQSWLLVLLKFRFLSPVSEKMYLKQLFILWYRENGFKQYTYELKIKNYLPIFTIIIANNNTNIIFSFVKIADKECSHVTNFNTNLLLYRDLKSYRTTRLFNSRNQRYAAPIVINLHNII